METPDGQTVRARWSRARDRAGLIVSWGLWAALTAGLFSYIGNYTRNIPVWDEFAMVQMLTGVEPVSLNWAWAQHYEHRPVIPRLIMAGLFRFVSTDFRVLRYADAVLLSMMAAGMLLAARKIRGCARLTDAAIPLALLNIAQGECLHNGFAINLLLTSGILMTLIAAAGSARPGDGGAIALAVAISLVLLPLCSGGGMVALPPLMLWLAGYVGWGWWSGRRPAPWVRAVGLGLLLAGSAVAVLYLRGYTRPDGFPPPASVPAFASTTLKFLSQTVYPGMRSYALPAGLFAVALVTATLVRLGVVSARWPGERPRALMLVALILSMLAVAASVGFARSRLGPRAGLESRFLSLGMPLFCALYVAWLAYGSPATRAGVPAVLLALILLAFPESYDRGHSMGLEVLVRMARVEQGLRNHVPTAVLLERASGIHTDRNTAYGYFRMLKAAKMGAFAELQDDRVATAPRPVGTMVR